MFRTKTLQAVNLLRHAIGRAGCGVHAPRQIIGEVAGEVDAADGGHDVRPELFQLAKRKGITLASEGPRVFGPVVDVALLDRVRLTKCDASAVSPVG